jgi:thiol-disulfide isomerase/thioredoxin
MAASVAFALFADLAIPSGRAWAAGPVAEKVAIAGTGAAADKAAVNGPAASAELSGARERAPAFRLDDVDGNPFDLGASLGREVILLDFWATYCVPCLAELNAFKELQNRYGPRGFRVVAVSVDQPQTMARRLREGQGLSLSGAHGCGTGRLPLVWGLGPAHEPAHRFPGPYRASTGGFPSRGGSGSGKTHPDSVG